MAIHTWSLTAANNATSDASINWAEGQTPGSVNNSARAMMAAIKAGFNDIAGVSTLGGTGDAFTLTLSQSMTSLTNAVVGFFATRTNTGAVTLNVDALGAKPLRMTTGVALAAGEIVSGQFYVCAYNTTNQEWIIVGSGTIQNSRMATMPASTVKGNVSGSAAVPSDVTLAALGSAMATAGAALVPSGVICMWSGSIATVPSGWYLCNGLNGTPDLRDKFIIGAAADDLGVAKTNVTGAATQSGGTKDAVTVSHTHTATVTDPGHTHDTTIGYTTSGGGGSTRQWYGRTGTLDVTGSEAKTSASNTTGITVANSTTGVSGTNQNLPPYYALAFIMKA